MATPTQIIDTAQRKFQNLNAVQLNTVLRELFLLTGLSFTPVNVLGVDFDLSGTPSDGDVLTWVDANNQVEFATPPSSGATDLSKNTIADTQIDINSSTGTDISLISGTDLKTVNSQSIIGPGNITISPSSGIAAARAGVGEYLPVIPFRVLTTLFIQADNRQIWQPVDIPFDCEIDEIILEVITGAASQSCIIALYQNNPSTNKPGTVLVKQAVDLSTSGVKTLSFPAITLSGNTRRLWLYRWSTAGSGAVTLYGPSSNQILATTINSGSFANNNSVLTVATTYPASDALALVDTIDNPTGLVESGLNTLQFGFRVSSIL